MKRKKSNERLNVTATTTTRYLKHTLGIIRWMRTTMNRMYACLSCRTVNVRLIISSPCVKSIFIIILFCFFNCGIRLKANVIKFSKHSNWFPSSTCYYYSFIAAILLALCIFICSGFSCHTQMFHFFLHQTKHDRHFVYMWLMQSSVAFQEASKTRHQKQLDNKHTHINLVAMLLCCMQNAKSMSNKWWLHMILSRSRILIKLDILSVTGKIFHPTEKWLRIRCKDHYLSLSEIQRGVWGFKRAGRTCASLK